MLGLVTPVPYLVAVLLALAARHRALRGCQAQARAVDRRGGSRDRPRARLRRRQFHRRRDRGEDLVPRRPTFPSRSVTPRSSWPRRPAGGKSRCSPSSRTSGDWPAPSRPSSHPTSTRAFPTSSSSSTCRSSRHRPRRPLPRHRVTNRPSTRICVHHLRDHARLHSGRRSHRRARAVPTTCSSVAHRRAGPCSRSSDRGPGTSPVRPVSRSFCSCCSTCRSGSAGAAMADQSDAEIPACTFTAGASRRSWARRCWPWRPVSASSEPWRRWATSRSTSATSPTGRRSPSRPACPAPSSASAWPSSASPPWAASPRRVGRPVRATPDAARDLRRSAWRSRRCPPSARPTGGSWPSSPSGDRCSAPPPAWHRWPPPSRPPRRNEPKPSHSLPPATGSARA